MTVGMKSIGFAAGVDRILQEWELPPSYPSRVEHEAATLPSFEVKRDRCQRRDLTSLPFVTIDGEQARDFDDAICVEALKGGGFRLWVSIADVSHYVAVGSELDREARQRGTSAYFPDRVLPMLPERLSNDLCSLVPGKERPTVTVELDFDAEGERHGRHLYRSFIVSAERLTYGQVRRLLKDQDPVLRGRYRRLLPSLEAGARLAERLRSKRKRRGSLDFDLPEPEIILDLEGEGIEEIVRAERNLAHRMIEEFMIVANEAVAEFMKERQTPGIYRIHEDPPPEKMKLLVQLLHHIGVGQRLGVRVTTQQLARVSEAVEGRPEEKIVRLFLLRSMSQAVYATDPSGHFGLASSCYTHFTSPIRRYPDLMVHRVVSSLLASPNRHPPKVWHGKELERIAKHCTERERLAMKAEWASRDLAAAFFMREKIGEIYPAVVSGVSRHGVYVELVPYLVEGMIPFKMLKDDYYMVIVDSFEARGRRLKKRFRVGDPLRVRVAEVDLKRRWVNFGLAN